MTESLAHITFGLGWDPAGATDVSALSRKDIDLNAAALAFVGDRFTDVAYHEQLTSRDGAMRHRGDSVTGDGSGENEVISVDLTRLDPEVTTIVFLVTSYSGQRFSQIDNGFCRIVDNVTGVELVRLDLDRVGAYTGMVFGKLHRVHQGWAFAPIGQPIVAQHIVDAVPQLTAHLR